MANRIKIVNGPSKWDLMMALFEKKVLTFEIDGGTKIKVSLHTLSNEDGWDTPTPDGWITGNTDSWLVKGKLQEPFPGAERHRDYLVYAAYSSENRSGVLNCIEGGSFEKPDNFRFDWVKLVLS